MKENDDIYRPLTALFLALVLALLHIFIPEQGPIVNRAGSIWNLIRDCIPSAIVVLIVIPLVYLLSSVSRKIEYIYRFEHEKEAKLREEIRKLREEIRKLREDNRYLEYWIDHKEQDPYF